MAGNSNLQDSIRNKQDEFYTEIGMIENELKNYRQHFRDKVVLCNCDDPYESNFFKYFVLNFNLLGLKKLICTCFAGSFFSGQQISLFDEYDEPIKEGVAYKIELTSVSDMNGDGSITLKDVDLILHNKDTAPRKLKGNGDFRSKECIELLKEADIVVTNPPFSLFREYIAQLIEYKKLFLIIGNQNNIAYKEVFPLFRENRVWLGNNAGHFWFKVPNYYEEKNTDFKIDETGQKWRRMGNICWYTNLDFPARHDTLKLYKHYTAEEYPQYLNYKAIEVPNTKDIPMDYYGEMGVPISFMSKYNPDQFELIGYSGELAEPIYLPSGKKGTGAFYLLQNDKNIKRMYTRILIRRRENEN